MSQINRLDRKRTFTEFLIALALSVVFMYMIPASLYESISHPFTILLALPLAVPFALFSLWASPLHAGTMTTLALVGGMLPLALGTGPGAEERRAVAVAVI